MKTNKTQYLALVLVMVFILMSASSYAQGPKDIGFGGDDDTNDEPTLPISGLIVLGLAVGGYLGIRQIRKQD
jgi:hypothetical protein